MPDIRLLNGSSGSDWPVVVESGTTGFVWKKKKRDRPLRFFFFNSLEKLCEGEGDKNLREEEEEELKGRRNK